MNKFTIRHHNYSDFVHEMAKSLSVQLENNRFELPASLGTGFCKGIDLDNGLSILTAEVSLRQSLVLDVPASSEEYYVLHFEEAQPESEQFENDKPENALLLHTGVYVRSSLYSVTYFVPAGTTRSVSILMPLSWLQRSMEENEAAVMLNYLREIPAQKHHLQLLDAEYRIIIEKLLNPSVEPPLKELFMNNRVMLLIEKFFTKHSLGLNSTKRDNHLTSEELERLAAVEHKLINGEFEEAPTIDNLAKMAAMSATKLKRSFKSIFGLPVYEYYQKHRMHVAKEILLSGSCTVKQAGQQVGYQNISHFAAAFKKIHGILPSQVLVHK